MQGLLAPPRDHLTEAQVLGLLSGRQTEWSFGCEVLTAGSWSDISSDLVGGTITWNGSQDIHRSCQIQLTRELAWGRDRVRPYCIATHQVSGVTARFNLGVFIMNTPDDQAGEDPTTFDVTGEDSIGLFAAEITDTVVVPVGSRILDTVRDMILTTDPGATVLSDATAAAATVQNDDMVWAIASGSIPARLEPIRALLAAINYGIRVDQDGAYRLTPAVDPVSRAVEWRFDADAPNGMVTTPVAEQRKRTRDFWKAYNAWRFISNSAPLPTEGDGIYTPPDYQSGGLSSIDALGVRNQHTVFLDAADQDALAAQGDAIVAADKRVVGVYEFGTYPLPIADHDDVVMLTDSRLGGTVKLVATEWVLDMGSNGEVPADMQWTWSTV